MRIKDLFNIAYGCNDFEDKSVLPVGNIPLVSSTSENRGVFGFFDVTPTHREGVIAIARTGSVGYAFAHCYPVHITSDAIVLTPKAALDFTSLEFYATYLTRNRFRFSYGRKVTPERIGSLPICPIPSWAKTATIPVFTTTVDALKSVKRAFAKHHGKPSTPLQLRRVRDIFRIVPGHDYELCNLTEVKGGIPFVSRTAENNGISAYVERTEDEPTPAGCLTVALGGSVLSTFLQPVACYESFHVATLHPIEPMTDAEKLWYATAIRAHRFRYSYGRQANKELPNLLIPVCPAWVNDVTVPS